MKTAMIWGADGGIGSAILTNLAEAGWTTVAVCRHPDTQITADYIFEADVSQPFFVQQAVHEAAMEIDEIDLWVYCVGDITSSRVKETNAPTWQRILDANLTGAYQSLYNSLPFLAENAHIMFIGAVSERLRLPGLSAYAAAKAGLEAFVEVLAKEERKRKVTIVRPSAVKTDFWGKVPFRMPGNAMPAEAVATAVLNAYDEGHTGKLDI